MDPQVQASFIPKRSLDVSAPRHGSYGGLLFLVSFLFFVASLVAAGGVVAYTQYLNSAITSKSKSLTLAEGAYDPGAIQDLVRMDARLTQAKMLLSKHVAATGVFAFLSSQTLANVSFTTFDYSLGDNGTGKITMQGTADSFSTVALQSDQFSGNKLLKDVIFTGITADQAGHVSFNVSATVDPSVLSYTAALGSSAAVVPVTTPAPAATTTSKGTFGTTTQTR